MDQFNRRDHYKMKDKFWPKFVTEKSRSKFVTEILTEFSFFW